jgi:small subunit ribosomal protein S5
MADTKLKSNQTRNPRQQDFDEQPEFQEVVIAINRVARVVKGGRRFRFQALVAVGDGAFRVGVGVSKGGDVQAAIVKATAVAKKNMINIPLYAQTIPHDVEGKVGGSRIMLKPASPGTGIIAGGTVRAILNLTNINNILSKSLGSSNKINTAYATLSALQSLVPKKEWMKDHRVDALKLNDQPKAKASAPAKKAEPKTETEVKPKAAKTKKAVAKAPAAKKTAAKKAPAAKKPAAKKPAAKKAAPKKEGDK